MKLNEQELLIRLSQAKTNRTLIKDKNNEEMLLYIEHLLKVREVYYNHADFIINGNNININLFINEILNTKM